MTATADALDQATDPLDGLKIIDCDSHWTEPPDLWTARVPATMRSKVPVMETHDGYTAWYLDGQLWAGTGGNTIERGNQKILGAHMIHPFDEIDASAWDVEARLGLLDLMGVYAQVLYPNAIGFSSNHIVAIEDLAQREMVAEVYNDYLMEVQQASGERLFPQAMLPIWDMDLCVREIARMAEKGARGFTLTDKPTRVGLPELDEPYFAPMWEALDAIHGVVNFHIGSGGRRAEDSETKADRHERLNRSPVAGRTEEYWDSFGLQRRLAVFATQMYMSNVRIVVNLCMSDLFDRYPHVKVVSAESGIGWVPFVLEAMEYQLDQMVTHEEEMIQQRRPTEYFRDHIYVMFWFEKSAPKRLVEDIGVRNIFVETDVPHPTCLYPGAREHFAEVLGDLDEPTRRRILQDNAAEAYKIPV